MEQEINIRLDPEVIANAENLKKAVANQLEIDPEKITEIRPVKRSLDARKKAIKFLLRARVFYGQEPPPEQTFEKTYPDVSNAPETIIIGAGPAGLFGALKLIEKGIKPIILERGKDVKSRRRDLATLNRNQGVNPDSNYCFGEGGAGTYSDGKLYTRSNKRGSVQDVLEVLVNHGAQRDILVDAHPHIGTNKLPGIITAMRAQILASGGAVHFDSRVTGFEIKNEAISGVQLQNGNVVEAKAVILATGHSARDIYHIFHQQKLAIEAKPFALGVRVEHPQALIDKIQYGRPDRGEFLPPSSYSLVQQVGGGGVYSFCMCPGGIIAPCATAEGEVVTNGWSPSKRNNPYANSGIVVSIDPEKLNAYAEHGPLAGMMFQADVEKNAWKAGGESQSAPAQRLTDFIENKVSSTLPDCSYLPGIVSADLRQVLPGFVRHNLREGLMAFGKKMRGYMTDEAVVVGVESRTSSPVRIPRDKESLEHPQVAGLYPCGEGAGYAGGIVSAAIDGERCAAMAALFILNKGSKSH